MYTCFIQSFKILTSFCSSAGWFESYQRHVFACCGSNETQSCFPGWHRTNFLIHEPCFRKRDLSVLQFAILQTCEHSRSIGPEMWVFQCLKIPLFSCEPHHQQTCLQCLRPVNLSHAAIRITRHSQGGGRGGGGVPVPLFPSKNGLVPQKQNLDFLCPLFPKIAVFPCSPEKIALVPLFPKPLGGPQ